MSQAIINEIKKQFVGKHCFLVFNGKEYDARIIGNKERFAHIATIREPYISVEYSWHTVNRIMRTHLTFYG